jgi:tetratricopeptide (TPR) repeat protein
LLAVSVALQTSARTQDLESEDETSGEMAEGASGDAATSAETDGLGEDPEGRAAFQLLRDGKLLGVREAAERLLRRSPDSYAAHFLLGYALHRAEGNLPLALYHLKRARRDLEKKHGKRPKANEPWLWHASTLEELASVAGEMGLHQERLGYLEARDEAYDPDWPADRGWPLMRLRRYADARAAVEAGLQSEQPFQISTAKTTLCAIESELLKRREAYEACMDAAAYDREANQGGPHTFTNAAGAAQGLLRMDEAERLVLEGTRHFQEGATSNPWLHLMGLYIAEGRTAEALDAVREMFAWQRAQPAYMDEQTRAETEFASAVFLLVTGHAAEAARIADRTLQRPDRTGFTSAEPEQLEAGTALLDAAANRVAAERNAEQASWSGWRNWLKARLEARRLRAQAWQASRRAASLIGSDRMLVATLRPYLAGSVAIPEWMEGELCAVLGPGVVEAALEQARREEDLDALPEAAAYFDAFEAETALLQGRGAHALELATRALVGLPKSEVLLQARVAAIGAQAALDEGDAGKAVQLFDQALQADPGIVRRLGLALPCRIKATGGEVASTAARIVRRSPRFLDEGGGFTVRIDGTQDSGTACLTGPQGAEISCASVTPRAGESPTDAARRLVAELHEQAFAPRVDLTQADLQSLDGSTTAAGGRAAERFRSIIDGLTGAGDGRPAPP